MKYELVNDDDRNYTLIIMTMILIKGKEFQIKEFQFQISNWTLFLRRIFQMKK